MWPQLGQRRIPLGRRHAEVWGRKPFCGQPWGGVKRRVASAPQSPGAGAETCDAIADSAEDVFRAGALPEVRRAWARLSACQREDQLAISRRACTAAGASLAAASFATSPQTGSHRSGPIPETLGARPRRFFVSGRQRANAKACVDITLSIPFPRTDGLRRCLSPDGPRAAGRRCCLSGCVPRVWPLALPQREKAVSRSPGVSFPAGERRRSAAAHEGEPLAPESAHWSPVP